MRPRTTLRPCTGWQVTAWSSIYERLQPYVVGGRQANRATTKRVELGCTAPAATEEEDACSLGGAAFSPKDDSPGLARGWASGLSGVSVLKLSELQTMRGLAKSVGARRATSLHLGVGSRSTGDTRPGRTAAPQPPIGTWAAQRLAPSAQGAAKRLDS